MPRHYSQSEIAAILAEAQSGVSVRELLRRHGVSRATYFRWRADAGKAGISVDANANALHRMGAQVAADADTLRRLRAQVAELKRVNAMLVKENEALRLKVKQRRA